MAAPKKATHEVVHPKLQMAVGGVLQRVPVGTQLALSDAQAKSLLRQGKIVCLKEKKTIDLNAAKAVEKAASKVVKDLEQADK